ncbi:MAG: metallopeptidase TldD-related protein [Halobacteria archaeon]
MMWALLESVLRAARRHGDAAEVYGEGAASLALLAENGKRARAEFSRAEGVALRLRRRGRWGLAYLAGPPGPGDAESLAARAAANARASPAPAAPLRLPGRRKFRPVPGTWDPRLARLDERDAHDALHALLGAAARVSKRVRLSEARVSLTASRTFLANSLGLQVSDRGTYAAASATALAGDVSGDEYAMARRARDIDWERVGRWAAEAAWESRRPKPLEPGTYDLLLAPRALVELVQYTTATHFSGDSLLQGATPYRRGARAMAPGFSLVDDGRLPAGWSSGAADGEGVPRRRNDLVRNGVVTGFLYDLATAARARASSTGNGNRSLRSAPGAGPTNLLLDGPRRKTSEMEAERALLVTDLIGAHTSRRASGEFSVAVQRGFLRPAGTPVKGAMLAGSSVELLRQVEALGDDVEARGLLVAPTVRVAGWRVTG